MLGFNNNKEEDIKNAQETGEMGNLDPMDAPLKNPPEEAPETPEEPAVEDIASRLGGSQEVEEKETDAPEAEVPTNFDPSMFTQEQLQALKRMLNSTPDRPTNKNKGTVIQLREINGKVVRDFSKAFNGFIQDPEEPTRRIPTVKIKVSFFGQEEPEEMLYSEFMESTRRKFKVESTRIETEEVEEGETISNETGQLVTMVTVYHHRFYTIDVDGTKVEVPSKIVNA